MAKPSRSTKMRRFLFTVDVKPEHLVSYKMHHDNIWKEVAGGLRQAGIKRLTTWQLQATNRLAMLIGVSGTVDLGAAVGPGSVYLGDPRCEEWESLMNSYFIGGDWTELVEIHSDDCEWNASLGLSAPVTAIPEALGEDFAVQPHQLKAALVVAAAAAPSPDARAEAMRRYMFTVEVKPECLASYKSHHDNIWPEVAAGLRRAGIAQLTTWQLGNSTRLFMYIETAGDIDLGAAVGPGSTYREHAKCIEWENLMDSFFVGGDWTQMSEIHSDDIEWNAALSLPPPSAMATPTRVIRFIGADGEVHLGEEPSAAGAQSALLSGSILDGTQKRTGKYATVVTLLAPLIPTNIFCIGLNYMRHYEESAKKRGIALPAKPVIFMKPSSALNHPGGDIYIPDLPRGDELDYEIELAVVIGKAARNVSAADALDYVAGYTVSNDVSSRHWQKQSGAGQWIKGKSFDTFCPLGPVFVSSAAIADPQNLSCKTRVNGETRQDSNTSDMIFTVARIVEWLSTDMTLLPGTVILTGTPEGVGAGKTPPVWLVEGDVVECEIESIGILRNCVTRAPTLSAL